MLKVASWNVNSLKVRLEQVLNWFETSQVDVLALQETKVIDDSFPKAAFLERGYHIAFSGQKTYNGVAVISRHPIENIVTEVVDFPDPQRRLLAITTSNLRLINLYVPNGSTLISDKYSYKLHWLKKITEFIAHELNNHSYVAVVGDFNIAPDDRDVHDPLEWKDCVLVSPPERQAFSDLLTLGLHDSFRNFPQEDKIFSWWDYRAANFRRNRGLRIDLILLNRALNQLCTTSKIDKTPRKSERPSDHAPVWVELEIEF